MASDTPSTNNTAAPQGETAHRRQRHPVFLAGEEGAPPERQVLYVKCREEGEPGSIFHLLGMVFTPDGWWYLFEDGAPNLLRQVGWVSQEDMSPMADIYNWAVRPPVRPVDETGQPIPEDPNAGPWIDQFIAALRRAHILHPLVLEDDTWVIVPLGDEE